MVNSNPRISPAKNNRVKDRVAGETLHSSARADEEAGGLVLVISDNTPVLEFLAATLLASGRRIHIAMEAEAALGLAEASTPQVALVDLLSTSFDSTELVLALCSRGISVVSLNACVDSGVVRVRLLTRTEGRKTRTAGGR